MSDQRIPVDTGGFEHWFAMPENGFWWPTPGDAYIALSRDNLAALINIWRGLDADSNEAKAYALKLCYVNHDLVRLGCLAIDVAKLRGAGLKGVCDTAANPLFNFFSAGGDPSGIEFARNDWPQNLNSILIWRAKAVGKKVLCWLQGISRAGSERYDLISSNELLEHYIASTGKSARRIFPYLLDRPMPKVAAAAIAPLAEAIADCFVSLVEPHLDDDQVLRSRLHEGARRVCHGHLGRAWEDLHMTRISGFANRPADALISGTPKYLGRLLSLVHRERGGTVYRFAHGGERAFFDDAEWPSNEFFECDRYHCFSGGEAENTRRRLETQRVPWIGGGLPEFIGQGSLRHAVIRDQRRPVSGNGGENTLLYVPNDYTGENFYLGPRFRVNDVLYTDWQVWLLRTLSALGFSVVTKAHPAETPARIDMLSRICCSVDTGPLELSRFDSR